MQILQKIRKNNGFGEEDFLIIGAVVLVVALFIFFQRKKPDDEEVLSRKNIPVLTEQVDLEESFQTPLRLLIDAQVNEEDNGGYLALSYEVVNTSAEAVFLGRGVVPGESLFFEATDPRGRIIVAPDKKPFFKNFHFRKGISLEPGKPLRGSIRISPQEYPDYVPGKYSIQAFLAIYEKDGREILYKVTSNSLMIYIPALDY